jgi:hypothetical protein
VNLSVDSNDLAGGRERGWECVWQGAPAGAHAKHSEIAECLNQAKVMSSELSEQPLRNNFSWNSVVLPKV